VGRGKDTATGKHDGIYLRVSSKGQDTASHVAHLKRRADGQDGPVSSMWKSKLTSAGETRVTVTQGLSHGRSMLPRGPINV
jgi:hypothetical protein